MNNKAIAAFVTALADRVRPAVDGDTDPPTCQGSAPDSWKRKAKLFTRTPSERVYVIDCPDGLQRQCYEIASTSAEYYVVGSSEDIPTDGATDFIVEADQDLRRAKMTELCIALSRELPSYKRLSVYTNDDLLTEQIRTAVTVIAKARLEFFAVFRIEKKRQGRCPAPVIT
jgi:hypothetical protein